MRKLILILILILPIRLTYAQSNVSLDSCYNWARENYPNLKQGEIWHEITSLKQENLKTNYLPQVSLNGQVTYQSDVTKVNVSLPGFSIPFVSKDQYKAYAEFKQTIWDGGLTEVNQRMEEAILLNNLSQLEVEMYKLHDQVVQAFFTTLAMGKQKEVLSAQKKVIGEKLKMVNSGIKNQTIETSAALVLEAEILAIEQNELQLEAGEKTALQMLSILTGKSITEGSRLTFQEQSTLNTNDLIRPEQNLFLTQKSQLDVQSEMLAKARNPKIFGFGQLGYGRPGLNMLNDKFDSYYLVGAGLSWNAFDWKKTSRQMQILQLNQQMINQQEATFNQNISLLLAQQYEQISKLENMLEKDSKIVNLRIEITKATGSKLENGTITSSDYIQDLQIETMAKLNSELHKIQLDEAKIKYNLIKGKSNP